MNHQRKKPQVHKQLQKKVVQKYQNLSQKKAPIPFNVTDIADAATIDYNNNTNIDDPIDNTSNKNKNAQIAAKNIVKKYRNLARKEPYQRPAKKLTMAMMLFS